jgi:hypothetical protein
MTKPEPCTSNWSARLSGALWLALSLLALAGLLVVGKLPVWIVGLVVAAGIALGALLFLPRWLAKRSDPAYSPRRSFSSPSLSPARWAWWDSRPCRFTTWPSGCRAGPPQCRWPRSPTDRRPSCSRARGPGLRGCDGHQGGQGQAGGVRFRRSVRALPRHRKRGHPRAEEACRHRLPGCLG